MKNFDKQWDRQVSCTNYKYRFTHINEVIVACLKARLQGFSEDNDH